MDPDTTSVGVDSGEEISDDFLCCVCLELMFKPVVLQCGHISCFWCVHESMNKWYASRCPICRNVYNHFPSVCWTLHFLLMKLYPITYDQREEHILREERKLDCFSPQFGSQVEESCSSSPSQLCLRGSNIGNQEQEGKYPDDEEKLEVGIVTEAGGDATSGEKHAQELKTANVKEELLSQKKLIGNSNLVEPADLLCPACKELLFQPVVLNCGDVFCQACIVNCTDENGQLKCQICQSTNPKGFPKICRVLDRFLEENFPRQHAIRRDLVLANQEPKTEANSKNKNVDEGGSTGASESDQFIIHGGVGCDCCGVYPIIGERYMCRDCKEKMGYDLCGDCYRSRSKLPGRFNQRHTEDHRFELVDMPVSTERLITRGLQDAAATVILYQRLLPNRNNTRRSDDHRDDNTSSN